mmetsp:Transcript_63302/g.181602  ORF Transcript_63302/g.181602 Transcript_63302/m.181602 type:complete len:345 (+) Transcript_63302:1103-2137(+)
MDHQRPLLGGGVDPTDPKLRLLLAHLPPRLAENHDTGQNSAQGRELLALQRHLQVICRHLHVHRPILVVVRDQRKSYRDRTHGLFPLQLPGHPSCRLGVEAPQAERLPLRGRVCQQGRRRHVALHKDRRHGVVLRGGPQNEVEVLLCAGAARQERPLSAQKGPICPRLQGLPQPRQRGERGGPGSHRRRPFTMRDARLCHDPVQLRSVPELVVAGLLRSLGAQDGQGLLGRLAGELRAPRAEVQLGGDPQHRGLAEAIADLAHAGTGLFRRSKRADCVASSQAHADERLLRNSHAVGIPRAALRHEALLCKSRSLLRASQCNANLGSHIACRRSSASATGRGFR